MDVEPEIKEAIGANAKKCGLSLTYYLAHCGVFGVAKSLPPEVLVQAKNLLCDFESRLLFMEDAIEDYMSIIPYVEECRELTRKVDRLLLDVQG